MLCPLPLYSLGSTFVEPGGHLLQRGDGVTVERAADGFSGQRSDGVAANDRVAILCAIIDSIVGAIVRASRAVAIITVWISVNHP